MSNLKRHFEYFTQQEQPLKQRSRFWTWYMRGLHGDMDTRYDPVTGRRIRSPGPSRAARSGSLSRTPAATVLVPELSPASKELARISPRSSSVPPSASLRFKPLASDTYGYNPRGLVVGSRGAPILDSDKPWQDWSAPETVPSDSFESPATYVPRKRAVSPAPLSKPTAAASPAPAPIATPSYSVPRTQLRRLPLEAELDDLLGLMDAPAGKSKSGQKPRIPQLSASKVGPSFAEAQQAIQTLRSFVEAHDPFSLVLFNAVGSLDLFVHETARLEQN